MNFVIALSTNRNEFFERIKLQCSIFQISNFKQVRSNNGPQMLTLEPFTLF